MKYSAFFSATTLVCLSGFVFAPGLARAALIHRYSFQDGLTKDLIGHVDGKLKGAGAMLAEGKLVLKNDESASGEKISCLEFAGSVLPQGLNASIVVWITAKDVAAFARVFNFGDSEGGEGKQFIYLTPRNGEGYARAAITGSDVSSKTYIDFEPFDDGRPHCVAVVIDGLEKKLRVFVDGTEPKPAENLGDNTLDLVKPVENWLGKSSFAADAGLRAAIDEFRIYDRALSPAEVAAVAKAGPSEARIPAVAPPAKSP